jgi:hypothetical protein
LDKPTASPSGIASRAVAQDEFGRADRNVVPEIAIVAQLPACLGDLRGEGDKQRIDETTAPERLPNQQHGNERAAADRQTLVVEVEPRETGASAPAIRGQFEVCRNGHEQPGCNYRIIGQGRRRGAMACGKSSRVA